MNKLRAAPRLGVNFILSSLSQDKVHCIQLARTALGPYGRVMRRNDQYARKLRLLEASASRIRII